MGKIMTTWFAHTVVQNLCNLVLIDSYNRTFAIITHS